MSILVNHLLAAPTHNAEKSIIKRFALVCQPTLEVRLVVDPNVSSVLNVATIRLVQIKNVPIPALEHADKTPNVEWIIIVLFAIVWMDIPVILSQDVIRNHVRKWKLEKVPCLIYCLSPAPVIPPQQDLYRDPCNPTPCGPLSQCRDINGSPSCSCLATYIGAPPNCRPECSVNSECPSNKACINEKCRDPCPGACGQNALCSVINHTPVCTCGEQDTGDPFTNCYPKPPPRKKIILMSLGLLNVRILM